MRNKYPDKDANVLKDRLHIYIFYAHTNTYIIYTQLQKDFTVYLVKNSSGGSEMK